MVATKQLIVTAETLTPDMVRAVLKMLDSCTIPAGDSLRKMYDTADEDALNELEILFFERGLSLNCKSRMCRELDTRPTRDVITFDYVVDVFVTYCRKHGIK